MGGGYVRGCIYLEEYLSKQIDALVSGGLISGGYITGGLISGGHITGGLCPGGLYPGDFNVGFFGMYTIYMLCMLVSPRLSSPHPWMSRQRAYCFHSCVSGIQNGI